MANVEKKAAEIMEKCGFIDKFVREMALSEEIRDIEEFARGHRPSDAKKTEPLVKFLPDDMANDLRDLRKERLKNRKEMDRSIDCSKKQIADEGIILHKTKKGTFATQKKISKKDDNDEDEQGLSLLFG